MSNRKREIQSFLFGQYFSDGIKITLGVLLPCLNLAYFDHFEWGITVSLGALCVSIADSPGPESHRRNAMGWCLLSIVVVALMTGFAQLHPFTMGLEILVLSFFFSMFNVYGARAAALGTAALVVMVLSMDQHLEPLQVLVHGGLILSGGLWYMFLSMVVFQIMPYRPAQQALGECIREIAEFMRIKAKFYQIETDIDDDFRKLIKHQVLVNEKQDTVREMLLKSRQIVKESSVTGRMLVLTFVDVMDLYEQITTIHYDYASMRQKFKHTGLLDEIAQMILVLAEELDNIGLAIQSNLKHKSLLNLDDMLEKLRVRVDEAGKQETEVSTLVLKKVVVNIRNLIQRIKDMSSYFDEPGKLKDKHTKEVEYNRFVTHQVYDPKLFLNNLSVNSSIFRYSLRVALVCLLGYIITVLFPFGHHGYWVLLTIIVILKPGFSLTKERNYQRLVGTLAGGAIGILILVFVQERNVLLGLLLFFMVMTYSLQRMNYILSVIFMTPFVLLLFNFLGAGGVDIAKERVLDTVIGSVIAFGASYLIFPTWEYKQLKKNMQEVVKANLAYLQTLTERLAGKSISVEEYKLARKAVYVSSANLAAGFQRMLSEPKSKQRHSKEIYDFVVLNHILSSYISTLISTMVFQETVPASRTYLRPARKALASLTDAAYKLDSTLSAAEGESLTSGVEISDETTFTADDLLLKEQLEFIQKVSSDISKVSETVQI